MDGENLASVHHFYFGVRRSCIMTHDIRAAVTQGSRGGKTNTLSFLGVFRWRHIVSLARIDQPGAALRQVR